MPLRVKTLNDRRVQKTHHLLRGALVSLIAEKPYDSIVVKEILDRANVGRSTFYMHFRDKDDLLVSGIHEMLGPLPRAAARLPSGKGLDRILWFSLPVFEHHHRHAHAWGDRIGTRGRAILHEHLRRVLADVIAEVMKKELRGRTARGTQDPYRSSFKLCGFNIRSGTELVAGQENVSASEGDQ
jgi:AcrR family transcriptional regulator